MTRSPDSPTPEATPAATPHLVDRSGSRYPLEEPRWRGEDGGPLALSPLPGMGPAEILADRRSHWRYAAALPDLGGAPLSLGEGMTPLLSARVGGRELRVKPEWFNPTGSFKDRGTSVMLTALRAQGIRSILEDSSGNGGASVAAYAAAAGMRAEILTPASTAEAKTLQARAHGAHVLPVAGSREDTAIAALRRAEEVFYASHNWHPMFLQGVKLIAYEIWEDLGFRAPDAVLLPAGAGSLVLGCALGFGELVRAGQIARVPRLLVAQPENCAPLAGAFASGAHVPEPPRAGGPAAPPRPTLAEGASISNPVRGPEVLAAVRASGGAIVGVSEAEIAAAARELAGIGLYCEPTSALPAAALPRFEALGLLPAGAEAVLVLTGSGLKAAAAIARILAVEP